jgi:hypothetical protein
MSTKAQQTGMTGVYLVAAQLANRGLIASPTSRSAFGADILLTDQLFSKSYSVQVKTNSKPASAWFLNKKSKEIVGKNHVYVFVNLTKTELSLNADYYIVPSKVVSKYMQKVKRPNSTWYAFYLEDAQGYKDQWSIFGIK